jgi:acyl-CoA synthetase (AMP-forming)/AMP-acid ligase II
MAVMEFNLWQVFDAVAGVIPQQEAIIDGERRFTYGQLADRCARLANVLISRGLGARAPRASLPDWEVGQDTVGIYTRNCAESIEASLAGYAARCAPFNVNHLYVRDELAYLLNNARAAALVYEGRYAPVVEQTLPLLDRAPLLLQIDDGSGQGLLAGALDYEQALAGSEPPPPPPGHSADDSYLLYTGGTTGMPKGVIWRQGDFWATTLRRGRMQHARSLDEVAVIAAGRTTSAVLICTPLMHGSGHASAFGALLHGDPIVFVTDKDHLNPADVWSLVERERTSTLLIVGDAYARPLLAELGRRSYATSGLHRLISGGASLSTGSKERFRALLPHVRLIEVMAASETGGALQRRDSGDTLLDFMVFEPQRGVSVLDESMTRVVEPGHPDVGWLAKSGHIPLGYLGDEAKTRSTFRTAGGARWSVPGDRARLRADGLIEVLGRDAATINSGGEKIFAEEVEEAVLRHPAVVDVAVVGRPSERWGQEVTALIAVAAGASLTDEDIRAEAGKYIARYKLPKAIVRVAAVKRTPTGKIDRPWAKALAEDSLPSGSAEGLAACRQAAC